MDTKKIRSCSYLLPPPGGEVVRQCLDEIDRLSKTPTLPSPVKRPVMFREGKCLSKYDVYQRVWIMENNKPKEKMVFAVIHSMDYYKSGVEVSYRLVDGTYGAGWGNNEGVQRSPEAIFETRESLLKSLGRT